VVHGTRTLNLGMPRRVFYNFANATGAMTLIIMTLSIMIPGIVA
jgi:hypothetical protein